MWMSSSISSSSWLFSDCQLFGNVRQETVSQFYRDVPETVDSCWRSASLWSCHMTQKSDGTVSLQQQSLTLPHFSSIWLSPRGSEFSSRSWTRTYWSHTHSQTLHQCHKAKRGNTACSETIESDATRFELTAV